MKPKLPLHSRFARLLARRATLITLGGALILNTGCFGKFPLSKALYKFNKESSDNEFVQSVMFWFMSPGYAFCVVSDTIVLNTIEFWSGQTLDLGVTQALPKERGAALASTGGQVFLQRTGAEEFSVINSRSGQIEGFLRKADNGDVLVCRADGSVTRRLPAVN
ncbi:DUF3332 family protein [Candidatus Sumerlaeota bacterium]|nr:DUF3332 family protein [Candidatus Sumerlaeota bacterium]MBI3736359.1 DUF3332 family protein [Candidatus Sumerlaeota bacterium]